jgi:acetylornithine deacetylase
MSPFELTRQLMAIPSVTGSEQRIGEYLSSQLESAGYRVERQDVGGGRFNLFAFAGPGRVMFCTHLDTVPPGDIPVREDDEFLYGRGACDTKGVIAAMIEAGGRLRRDGVMNFGYMFLVGEETDSIGAKSANSLKWDSEFVIVGEPTQNKLARAQKGTFLFHLHATGRAAHSGYPEHGDSAIQKLWAVLQKCQDTDWGVDDVVGKGTFNVGVFRGGQAMNIVPPQATASVMIRTVENCAAVEAKLNRAVANRATVEIVGASDPLMLHVVDGFETTVVSFGSDAPHLSNTGKRLLIGPGSILDAHTAGEKISKRELMAGVEIYETLVRKLLS